MTEIIQKSFTSHMQGERFDHFLIGCQAQLTLLVALAVSHPAPTLLLHYVDSRRRLQPPDVSTHPRHFVSFEYPALLWSTLNYFAVDQFAKGLP